MPSLQEPSLKLQQQEQDKMEEDVDDITVIEEAIDLEGCVEVLAMVPQDPPPVPTRRLPARR